MNRKAIIAATLSAALVAASSAVAAQGATKEASLAYFGRSSMRIVTAAGFVMYVDPYADGDYSKPANLVLVTHGHDDHNAVSLVKLAAGATVAAPSGAVSVSGAKAVKEGDSFTIAGVTIKAVPAYNKNHRRSQCVGYLISFDGITVYHAGDTSFIPEMANLAAAKVDYAFFPTDGYWNMGGAEARKCADAVKSRFVAAIHSSPDGAYNKAKANALTGKDVIALPPGTILTLTAAGK
jgi:L-ascorbate metabolism protein UlaG (beta-lactamase superfamily)